MMAGDDPTDDDVRRVLSALPEAEPAGAHLDDAVLVAHRGGTLSGGAAEAVDQHLATCGACREMLVDLGAVDQEAGVAQGLAAMAEATRAAETARRRWWLGGVAAAAAVVVALSADVARIGPEVTPAAYVAEGFEGVSVEKGPSAAPSKVRVYRPETAFLGLLRPQRKVVPPPEIAVYVSRPGGVLRTIATVAASSAAGLSVERGEGGTFRVRGVARDVFTEPGEHVVSFVIVRADARCEALAGRTLEAAKASCPQALGWQDVEARLEP